MLIHFKQNLSALVFLFDVSLIFLNILLKQFLLLSFCIENIRCLLLHLVSILEFGWCIRLRLAHWSFLASFLTLFSISSGSWIIVYDFNWLDTDISDMQFWVPCANTKISFCLHIWHVQILDTFQLLAIFCMCLNDVDWYHRLMLLDFDYETSFHDDFRNDAAIYTERKEII